MRPDVPRRSHAYRRRLVLAAILVSCGWLVVADPPSAAAGRYEVVQCDRSNRAFTDASFDRVNGADYGFLYRCEEDEDASSLQVRSITGTPQGRYGRISWVAPDETRIVGVDLEARMRNDAGHQARLSFLDGFGGESSRIATGTDEPSGFEPFARTLSDGGRQGFAATLICVDRDGCRTSDQARNWIRSVELTLEDRTAPKVVAGGSLAGSGWMKGSGTLGGVASDLGSGVRSLDVRVNGAPVPPSRTVPCSLIAGTQRATRLRPCPGAYAVQAEADTRAAPFREGANALRVCASDFGSGGSPGCTERTVMVDNLPPEVAFEVRDREDPELIRVDAADATSGLAGGSIAYRPASGGPWHELDTAVEGDVMTARVDSREERPGRYAFRAVAVDRAGNVGIGTTRRDGSEVIVEFPLREDTRLEASIGGARRAVAGYRDRPRLDVVLRGEDGPVVGQEVEVFETFATGSTSRSTGRTLRTDSRGRVALRLGSGPSRGVRVAFEGSRRYGSSSSKRVRLRVRGTASMSAPSRRVRAGRRLLLRGAVGVRGADIGAGKLVEVQVRGGGVGRFRTIGHAFRTHPRGRWSFRYRFDRFYERPTRYRFRLKVSRDAGFPYLTPVFSRTRTVTVLPRG